VSDGYRVAHDAILERVVALVDELA